MSTHRLTANASLCASRFALSPLLFAQTRNQDCRLSPLRFALFVLKIRNSQSEIRNCPGPLLLLSAHYLLLTAYCLLRFALPMSIHIRCRQC